MNTYSLNYKKYPSGRALGGVTRWRQGLEQEKPGSFAVLFLLSVANLEICKDITPESGYVFLDPLDELVGAFQSELPFDQVPGSIEE